MDYHRSVIRTYEADFSAGFFSYIVTKDGEADWLAKVKHGTSSYLKP